jgi:hypothetical protein
MKKQRNKKGELFRKTFAEKRRRQMWLRGFRLNSAMDHLREFPESPKYPGWLLNLLNRAAPIKIDLGNGWIECNSFGSIHAELGMISYRSRNHRSGCNALLGGIKLANIKGAELI